MTCLTCGVEIPPERRAAMPLAEFCVRCQAKDDVPPIGLEHVPDAMAESEIEPGQMWLRER